MEKTFLRTIIIRYENEINHHEVPLFRGAVIASMQNKANPLFHNHLEDNQFRFSYPLIQYKRIGGKAAIVCVDAGADVIGQFLYEGTAEMHLGERRVKLEVDTIQPRRILVQTWNSGFRYHLRRWLPLNPKNLELFQQATSHEDRIELLQSILTGNILSFAKGVNIWLEDQLIVQITKMEEPYFVKNKGIRLMAFDVEFTSNVSLPNYIGLGKNSSIGFGVVSQIVEKHIY